jgi:hypothetical protein
LSLRRKLDAFSEEAAKRKKRREEDGDSLWVSVWKTSDIVVFL